MVRPRARGAPRAALARLLAAAACRLLYRIRAVGRSHVPAGPALLVSNHVSYVDALLIAAASPRPVRFLMHRAYYELPVLTRAFRAFGAIPVASGDGPKAMAESFRRAREAIAGGEAVCIFAEGEISRHGQMQRFRKGLERLVEGSAAPIVPVHLDQVWGSLFSFSQGRLLLKRPRRWPYPVTVSFGEPLPPTASAFEVRQAILELGAAAFRRRLAGSSPLPLVFARRAKRRPLAPCAADSSGRGRRALPALAEAWLLGRTLAARAPRGRVGVLLRPSLEAFLVNAGLALSGRVAVNLDPGGSKGLTDARAARAGAASIVTTRRELERLGWRPDAPVLLAEEAAPPAWLRAAASVLLLALPLRALRRTAFSAARAHLSDEATVVFAGPGADAPGVLLTHANVLANVKALAQALSLSEDDAVLGVLPFSHPAGFMGGLWLPACLGAAAALQADAADARGTGLLASAAGATVAVATPALLRLWAREAPPGAFRALRQVLVPDGPGRERAERSFAERFGAATLAGYGRAELSPAATLNVPDIDWPGVRQTGTKKGTVGQPLPGVFMKVVDPDTGAERAPGEPGLLLVKGPNVMKGYLDEEATRRSLRDGYFATGDRARIDEDGFVTMERPCSS